MRSVSNYLCRDDALFDVICPELTVGSVESVPALFDRVVACKLNEPRSVRYTALLRAAQKAASSTAADRHLPKADRAALNAFVPAFRNICMVAFLDATLDHYYGKRRRAAAGGSGGGGAGGGAGKEAKRGGVLHSICTVLFSTICFVLLSRVWASLAYALDLQ